MALGYRSGGRCYWPGCPEKVFRDEAGEPYRTAAIAHIHGAYPRSARYKPEMTNDQRRSFSNLMLFCGPHHWIVDQDELKYPAERLRRWKARHEAEFGQGTADQADFVTTYRKHFCELHGYLEPPDFERFARVPAADLYVPGQEIRQVPGPGRPVPARPGTATRLTVADLPRLTDRTVLLGDPGGGKTTAARMMMRSYADDPAARTPFLVSLGAYAAEDPPGCSIAEYIERDLPATYECRPPDGLVGRLLRAGEALVIFDGLDEFTDGRRRRGLSRCIELFCKAYPLVPVLVTSREIGYDRARLDGSRFTCYRLGEFGSSEVEEYTRKWFVDPATAEAFLSGSADIGDLRSNPLLLSLMCSLYQDEEALPTSRAGLYERCAALLLRKWDDERGIRRTLPARVEVRPLVRHLAWWLFSQRRPVVKESRFLAEVTTFVQARGPGSADEAREAAEEFVEFCRERTWVLSPGVTASGERGCGFTHRTFLEYYAAAYIVAELRTTPEELAEFLACRVADGEWSVVDLLAVSVMERKTDGAADRVYQILLGPGGTAADRGELLAFLVYLLDAAWPSSATARKLIREALRHRIGYDPERETRHPLSCLAALRTGHELICDEIGGYVSAAIASGDPGAAAETLRVILDLAGHAGNPFWREWATGQAGRYQAEIGAASARSGELRTMALYAGAITLEQAIAMQGGLNALMQPFPQMLESALITPYPADLYLRVVVNGEIDAEAFAAIGRYVTSHPELPLTRASGYDFGISDIGGEELLREAGAQLSELAGLGLAVVHAICSEIFGWNGERPRAELPMPSPFRRTFRDWADGKADFTKA